MAELFSTITLEDKVLIIDDPTQDYSNELEQAGLINLPAGTKLEVETTEHGFKIWNPNN